MKLVSPKITPKNKHAQSILASSKIRLLRLLGNNPVNKNAKSVLLESEIAILQGFYSGNNNADTLYILFHGWEGSANSTYIQLLANSLYKNKQASVFRLNFRDHGATHHLNKEIFHSCRLTEVVLSVKKIIQQFPHKNIVLCGFSLGGNFALRVAEKAYEYKIRINKVFAISPPLNPKNSMIAIQSSAFYSKYFMHKWQKSLAKKAKVFPQYFDDNQYKSIKSLEKLTDLLIIRHSDYNSTDEYFHGYKITADTLKNIKIPCHIIAAWDDPVIPFADFMVTEKKPNINLVTSKFGGHCGFINIWTMQSWIEKYIAENT